ncbi:hypothetical protein GF382_00855 [Candidatus Falkowbacteria bacterium]|nr:hypothetical protein [Candidatus Falkowbacteria bacterium]
MKKTKNKYLLLSLILGGVFILSPLMALANGFDPNNIISDYEVLNYDSMSLAQIQDLLDSKDGYLANYRTQNPDGKTMTAAEVIYDRAQTNKISPKFIIVLLQKEMGLIEDKDPKQTQLDWATGYGCPDGGGCNERWRGFWKQVNSATLQFYDYIENFQDYKYQKGKTYTFSNPYSTTINGTVIVTPANNATAGLYNYTPHVYNGNYNFYRIWKRYFTKGDYPNGSLLQARGEVGVWLIQNGQKRPFLSKGALTSRFDENKIIQVEKSELDGYPKGAPLKFPNYSIVRSPKGNLFLLVDDKRRGFTDYEAFRKMGYNPEEIEDASWEDINSYIEGTPITPTSTYPTGALLQDNSSGGVYWVIEGKKAPLHDRVLLDTEFKNKKIIQVSPEELAEYTTVDPVMLEDGELLTSEATRAVYLIENGMKRPFISGKVFERRGYKWENIITVSPQYLAKYSIGKLVKEEM